MEFYHPANEDEIRQLILHARDRGLKVRVRGAGHSVDPAIYTDHFKEGEGDNNGINILLDRIKEVKIDKQKKQVTVQAGCHLGRDPSDPAQNSNLQNSLLYQIDRAGLAFPDLGGIIHQTIGGFLSTGSSGGSLNDSFSEQLVALKLIDGNGEIHEVSREKDSGRFFAAGVSIQTGGKV